LGLSVFSDLSVFTRPIGKGKLPRRAQFQPTNGHNQYVLDPICPYRTCRSLSDLLVLIGPIGPYRSYRSYRPLSVLIEPMGPYRTYRSLWDLSVLIGPYRSLSDPIGPYRTYRSLSDLSVLIGPYRSLSDLSDLSALWGQALLH
jgi:hypothetical protein